MNYINYIFQNKGARRNFGLAKERGEILIRKKLKNQNFAARKLRKKYSRQNSVSEILKPGILQQKS